MRYHVLAFTALEDTEQLLEVLVLVVLQQFKCERLEAGEDGAVGSHTIQSDGSVDGSGAGYAVNWQEYVVVCVGFLQYSLS